MTEFFSTFITWYMGHINYWTITLLMAIESSFIPFPSEIVIPPAAWKALDGDLNLVGILVAGTAGALIGALFNYYIAISLGRKVLYSLADTKWAHMLLIKKESLIKAEDYFKKYGNSSTFIGRQVPGIRQLISLPAGLARMDLKPFLIFTILGSALWNVILILLGCILHKNKELLEPYYHYLTIGGLGLGVLFFSFIVIKTLLKKKTVSPLDVSTKDLSSTSEKIKL